MYHLLLIGLGGALGALLRHGLSGLVHQWAGTSFPWGTLTVNLTGCLAIGVLWTLAEEGYVGPSASAFIFVGVLGAFTTFSSYGLETIQLLREGDLWPAIWNLTLSNGIGIPLALVGLTLGRYLLSLMR